MNKRMKFFLKKLNLCDLCNIRLKPFWLKSNFSLLFLFQFVRHMGCNRKWVLDHSGTTAQFPRDDHRRRSAVHQQLHLRRSILHHHRVPRRSSPQPRRAKFHPFRRRSVHWGHGSTSQSLCRPRWICCRQPRRRTSEGISRDCQAALSRAARGRTSGFLTKCLSSPQGCKIWNGWEQKQVHVPHHKRHTQSLRSKPQSCGICDESNGGSGTSGWESPIPSSWI